MRYLQLFFQMMAANLRGLMSFKMDFIVSFFGGLLSQTIGLLFISVLFYNVSAVGDWNAYQVALLYGYMFVAEGVLTLFFQGTNGLWKQARRGEFDRYLLRPLPIPFQIYGKCINLAGLGTVVTGLLVMYFSIWKLGIAMTPFQILLLVLSLVFGAVVRININFATSILPIWLEGATGLKGMVEEMEEMGRYPLDIYPKAFRVILLSLIPYAAISYVPTSVLLGKKSSVYFLILPIAMVLVIVIRIWLFNKAMEKYEGAGN